MIAALLTALAAVGCGSSASGSGGGTKTPTLAVVLPFSGSQAVIGQLTYPPCPAAAQVINAAGGVLGHPLRCTEVDDLGDAADAVPNVSKALATNSSIVAALGVDSNVAATVVPILNHAKVSTMSVDGLSAMDVNHYNYFWRNVSPDPANGAAMGIWAGQQHNKKVAVISQNDVGDTGLVPGAIRALAHAHVRLTTSLTIPGDASSYQSLVTRVARGRPDALIFLSDETTLGTFLAEYKTLAGGTVPRVITASAVLDSKTFSLLKASAGLGYVLSKISFVGPYVDTNTAAFGPYRQAMISTSKGKYPESLLTNGIVAALYDQANIVALAMARAHSTSSRVYNSSIPLVSTARTGAVVVHTYAAGLKALKHGSQIQYVGLTGATTWDKYHNSPGTYAAFGFTPAQGSRIVSVLPRAVIGALGR